LIIAATIIFWTAAFLVIYPYLIYPALLVCANRLCAVFKKANNLQKPEQEGSFAFPTVSIIVAAYNESAVISKKIENSLALKYPKTLEVIVISDGSTDDTADKVQTFANKYDNVKLVNMASQSGKTVGLNTAVPTAKGDILVFTDANAMYAEDALIQLTKPFENSSVGYTVGSALYVDDDDAAVNDSESLYWRYELTIKKFESDFYSVVGGDGAIYAIRAGLYSPLADYEISDFVNPLQIISKGYRGIFVPESRSYEHGTDEFFEEFRRKRRIVNRSWGAVRRNLKLFSMSKHKRFLFMLVSHKVIRWWSFPLVILSAITGGFVALQTGSAFYAMLVLGIGCTLGAGFIGWRLDKAGANMPRLIYLLYYFYLIGLAGLLGIADEIRGNRQTIWKPAR